MTRRPLRTFLLAAVSLSLLASCGPSKEEKAATAAAAAIRINAQVFTVAQAAAERDLIGKPACILVKNEGTLYTSENADLLPESALWRFLVSQGVGVRQNLAGRLGGGESRFYIRDEFRQRFDGQKLCFGKWAVVKVVSVKDGKGETRGGVDYWPFDVTMRLTKIRSAEWLTNPLISRNLTGPIKSITEDRTARTMLPLQIEQLPPPGSPTLDP